MRAVAVAVTAILLASCAHEGAPVPAPTSKSPLRVRVRLATEASPGGASGRLVVLMAAGTDRRALTTPPFLPGGPRLAAVEVAHLPAGGAVDLPADAISYPAPLASGPRGSYLLLAVLDRDHDYAYAFGADGGDLVSEPAILRDIDPAAAGPIDLVLTSSVPAQAIEDSDEIKWVETPSALLSAFWRRPMSLRAAVVLPRDHGKDPTRRWPALFEIHGFGGSARAAFRPEARRQILAGRPADFVWVILDATCSLGHHAFADSDNDGPWGRALVEELIPALERRFLLDPRPAARFLSGHSSGGWSPLWLQVTHPDAFNGTWSTAPDPVDFRSFTGIDVTPGTRDNAFRRPDGSPHPLVRMSGNEVLSFEQWSRIESVMGEYGGQLASFDAVFSPRGPDGRPMRLFDRTTGAIDPAVAEAWTRYDIRRLIERDWERLGPKLAGKLHVFVGGADTFHLDEATRLLCETLAARKADAVCEVVPDRTHFDLTQPDPKRWPDGFSRRLFEEALARYRRYGSMPSPTPLR